MMKVAGIRRSRTFATTELAKATLAAAHPAEDSPNTTVIEWEDRDHVTAVRSQLLAGLMNEGYPPNGGDQPTPGHRLYDALWVVYEVLRLPRNEAIE